MLGTKSSRLVYASRVFSVSALGIMMFVISCASAQIPIPPTPTSTPGPVNEFRWVSAGSSNDEDGIMEFDIPTDENIRGKWSFAEEGSRVVAQISGKYYKTYAEIGGSAVWKRFANEHENTIYVQWFDLHVDRILHSKIKTSFAVVSVDFDSMVGYYTQLLGAVDTAGNMDLIQFNDERGNAMRTYQKSPESFVLPFEIKLKLDDFAYDAGSGVPAYNIIDVKKKDEGWCLYMNTRFSVLFKDGMYYVKYYSAKKDNGIWRIKPMEEDEFAKCI